MCAAQSLLISTCKLILFNFLTMQKIGQKETDERNIMEMQGLIQGLWAPQRSVPMLFQVLYLMFLIVSDCCVLKLHFGPFPWVPSERWMVTVCKIDSCSTCLAFDRLFIRIMTSVWSCLAWPELGTPR